MDSTLLNQVRHLCRDRAAYEHLKAILVQQERVHQLSWEEQYAKIQSTSTTQGTDAFSNIIAREKALAQLAEAMQRSPSLDLVLQVAVQAAQKLLQVDRVAIFRHHPDERGEFITDAIATGVLSLAEMPERQHSLTRHIIESTQIEDSAQTFTKTFNSISNSSLSTHSMNLLEQIGIASYAANKIYVGQQLWGTIVAFHSSNYHSWSEVDRTSLSLISAQIGIAIAFSNLRQQSQSLAHDLQVLQVEVNDLQQTVNEIAKDEIAKAKIAKVEVAKDEIAKATTNETEDQIKSSITLSSPIIEVETESVPESIIDTVVQYLVSNELQNDVVNSDGELSNPELDEENLGLDQADQILEEESSQVEEKLGITDPPANQDLSDALEQPYEYSSIHQNRLPPTFLAPDSPTVLPDIESEDIESEQIVEQSDSEDNTVMETLPLFVDEINIPNLQTVEPILSESELVDLGLVEKQVVASEEIQVIQLVEQPAEEWEVDEEPIQLVEQPVEESELDEESIDAIAIDSTESVLEELLPTSNDLDPVIEPQFIETILMLAGQKATQFLINVIDAYLQEAPNLLWEIDRAITLQEKLQSLHFLNTLRSSSDYLGALILSEECRRLEAAVKADNESLIHTCLPLLEIEVERAIDALRIERSRYT
ncbi:MAG: GAF domain-containing protein [Pseudanabaena sp. ELA645]|jgi:HPt (histidine-containing phosphotransfer) domain-containing protein